MNVIPTLIARSRPYRMQPLFSSHDPEKGWGRLAVEEIEIRVVPSNHLGMLQEPYVQVLANQLRACLDRSQAERTPGKRKAVALEVLH